MSVIYKMNVLEELKARGYTAYKLRQGKILGERVIQQLRHGEIASWKTIETLCELLHCQIGDLVEYVPGDPVTDEN